MSYNTYKSLMDLILFPAFFCACMAVFFGNFNLLEVVCVVASLPMLGLYLMRIFLFKLALVRCAKKGETERRVVHHYLGKGDRLAPPSGVPFCLHYEVEREYFWEKVKAGNPPEREPDIKLIHYESTLDPKETNLSCRRYNSMKDFMNSAKVQEQIDAAFNRTK